MQSNLDLKDVVASTLNDFRQRLKTHKQLSNGKLTGSQVLDLLPVILPKTVT